MSKTIYVTGLYGTLAHPMRGFVSREDALRDGERFAPPQTEPVEYVPATLLEKVRGWAKEHRHVFVTPEGTVALAALLKELEGKADPNG